MLNADEMTLFEDNLKRVRSITARYKRAYNFDDIEQVALIGLYEAAKRYDPAVGTSFMAYARFYIRKEIIRNVFEKTPQLKVSRLLLEKVTKVKKYMEMSEDPEKLAELTGLSLDDIHEVEAYLSSSYVSVDQPLEGGGTFGGSLISVQDSWEDAVWYSQFLDSLDEPDRVLVTMLVGGYSKRAVAERLGLTARQVNRAIEQLKPRVASFMGGGLA